MCDDHGDKVANNTFIFFEKSFIQRFSRIQSCQVARIKSGSIAFSQSVATLDSGKTAVTS